MNFKIDNNKIIIITGPNTGGKTVGLKTVGLLALMTQSGLNIPVNEGSEICVFDKIFADIGDDQNIEQNLSTFSAHITNIKSIFDNVNENSLVLLDELGSGTDPNEGAALAIAIIEKLRDIGAIVIATTHYMELKTYALSTQNVMNACCEFDINTLRPTYKLLIGIPGKSYAFSIASKLGMPTEIINAAKCNMAQKNIDLEKSILDIRKNLEKTSSDMEKAKLYKQEIETLKNELQNQYNEAEKIKQETINLAMQESKKILLDTKNQTNMIIKELQKLQQTCNFTATLDMATEERKKLDKSLYQINENIKQNLSTNIPMTPLPRDIKPGDNLLIISLKKEAVAIEYPNKNNKVLVQSGNIKLVLPQIT